MVVVFIIWYLLALESFPERCVIHRLIQLDQGYRDYCHVHWTWYILFSFMSVCFLSHSSHMSFSSSPIPFPTLTFFVVLSGRVCVGTRCMHKRRRWERQIYIVLFLCFFWRSDVSSFFRMDVFFWPNKVFFPNKILFPEKGNSTLVVNNRDGRNSSHSLTSSHFLSFCYSCTLSTREMISQVA
jgi:hypothetical protein